MHAFAALLGGGGRYLAQAHAADITHGDDQGGRGRHRDRPAAVVGRAPAAAKVLLGTRAGRRAGSQHLQDRRGATGRVPARGDPGGNHRYMLRLGRHPGERSRHLPGLRPGPGPRHILMERTTGIVAGILSESDLVALEAKHVKHLEELGYVKAKEWLEHYMHLKNLNPDDFSRVANMVQKRYQLHSMNFTKTEQILPYVDKMFDLFNASYANLSSFVPISDEQKAYFKKKYISLINPEYIEYIACLLFTYYAAYSLLCVESDFCLTLHSTITITILP